MNKIKKIVVATSLLFFGALALGIFIKYVIPYQNAHIANSQRRTKLADAQPLAVNPDNLVGVWFGKGGPNRDLALTLTISSDERMGAMLHPGDPAEEVERQMESPYSTVGELEIDGMPDNGCGYTSLSLNGNASNDSVQLTGYRGKVGETPNPRLGGSLWEDTDRFQLSARLRATGMSGTLSTASNLSGCRPMILPFELSLVEVPAGRAAFVAPAAVVPAAAPVSVAAPKPNSFSASEIVATCKLYGKTPRISVPLDGNNPDAIELRQCKESDGGYVVVSQPELGRVCAVDLTNSVPSSTKFSQLGNKAIVSSWLDGSDSVEHFDFEVDLTEKQDRSLSALSPGGNPYSVECDTIQQRPDGTRAE
jgi:hypothetical protein